MKDIDLVGLLIKYLVDSFYSWVYRRNRLRAYEYDRESELITIKPGVEVMGISTAEVDYLS